LQRPGGRIVNVGSALGANYVDKLPTTSSIKKCLSQPWTIPGGIAEIDDLARNAKSVLPKDGDPYGASKALLHAYTIVHAKIEKDLIINAVTPGYIATDLQAGNSPTDLPSKGAIPPCYFMMDEKFVPNTPSGRYYGSDCVRSPIAFYRGPGDVPYKNDDDLVDLPLTAVLMPSVL
jgi:NAD(P)-dependent dehydrogenase (short-subunit alcohol dehydrogenase family)